MDCTWNYCGLWRRVGNVYTTLAASALRNGGFQAFPTDMPGLHHGRYLVCVSQALHLSPVCIFLEMRFTEVWETFEV